jgi:hypothetical protein
MQTVKKEWKTLATPTCKRSTSDTTNVDNGQSPLSMDKVHLEFILLDKLTNTLIM